jgi:hypothetical protein
VRPLRAIFVTRPSRVRRLSPLDLNRVTNPPIEYRVNYHNATDATARMAETLDQALWPAARAGRLGRPDYRASRQEFFQL